MTPARPNRQRRGQAPWRIIPFALALLLLIAACGGTDTAQEPDPAAPDDAADQADEAEDGASADEPLSITVGYTPPTLTVADFYINMARGFMEEAESLNMDVEMLIEAPSTHAAAEEQLTMVEGFIQQDVDFLWISPVAFEAGQPMMLAADDAGIPVVTGPLLEEYPDTNLLAYIGFSEFDAGALQAQYAIDEFGEDIQVAIIQGAPGEFNQQRVDGIRSVLDGTNAEIVAEPVANWDRQEALEAVETIVRANPELDVVLPVAGDMALGAVEALRTAGKLHEPTEVVGFDCLGQEVNSVIRGEEAACVFNNPMGIGALVARSMHDHLTGAQVETQQLVGLEMITPDNATTAIPAWFRGEEEPAHFPQF